MVMTYWTKKKKKSGCKIVCVRGTVIYPYFTEAKVKDRTLPGNHICGENIWATEKEWPEGKESLHMKAHQL